MIVTVTMPYWNVGTDVRRAAESIVAQTYPHWRLVIVNDGDPQPPWRWLDHLDDPRIIRFDLTENRGRYFVDAVIFEACKPDLWALQDADDWSEPRRFETLVPLAAEHGCAQAPVWKWRNGRRVFTDGGMDRPARPDTIAPIGRGWLAGVVAGDRLAQVGGFHPEFRVGWDTYLVNAVKLTGPFTTVKDPLYNRVVRRGSLTKHPDTRAGSALRNAAKSRRLDLYRRVCLVHESGGDTAGPVREDIPTGLADEVAHHAGRLERLL